MLNRNGALRIFGNEFVGSDISHPAAPIDRFFNQLDALNVGLTLRLRLKRNTSPLLRRRLRLHRSHSIPESISLRWVCRRVR